MMTAEFLTEALARAEEHESDFGKVVGAIYGVVFFDDEGKPVALDICTGMLTDVRVFAAAMVEYNQKYGHSSYQIYHLDNDGSDKATYIRRTALMVEA